MPRSKAEIRSWLLAQVNHSISDADGDLKGQCVSLIKGLMAYVGAPNPRAARGHAATAGNAYVAEGIGKNGKGWLTVCVNKTMASPYGHIWLDVAGEFNVEQNGAKRLTVTQNTRPLSQAHQLVNFDQWVTAAAAPAPAPAPAAAAVTAALPGGDDMRVVSCVRPDKNIDFYAVRNDGSLLHVVERDSPHHNFIMADLPPGRYQTLTKCFYQGAQAVVRGVGTDGKYYQSDWSADRGPGQPKGWVQRRLW